ncbi:ATP-dependent RNA helicase DDX19A [Oryzias melastigma]|uniref:RNA helicase n=1 Tax=Oryzias melastigma TaxID=30732 RepID=A0A3B3DTA6_ORYME|nr:ATP-dependent RNA helicase DDX19A [Oryzias melastigma]
MSKFVPQFDFSEKTGRNKTTFQGDVNGNVEPDETWDDIDQVDPAEASLLNKLLRRTVVENDRVHVEVIQSDPTSPLFSVKTFEELRLKTELLKGVYSMGFNRPSKIQETALPLLLAHPPGNLVAQSQSGTGKTAAFSLAMLSIVDPSNKWTQCLCIAPTYELALQIGQVIEHMGQFCPDVKVAYAIRGNRVERGVKLQEQIVIGTPGTLLDWCTKYKVIDLKKISMFVLDEADVMIDTQGFRDQSIRIQRALRKDCQMLLFSATFEDSLWDFAERVIPDANVIRLKREEQTLDNIKQFHVLCNNKEEKLEALYNLYGTLTIAQAIIFCRTRATASWLSAILKQEGHQVALLSGDLTVEQRAAVIERFRNGKEKVLVTTNVCSRGIDVEQVSIVVNFDLPVDMEGNADHDTYLHRIGRSGRFGKRGFAVNMVEGDRDTRILHQIQEHFHQKIPKLDTSNMQEMERIQL